MLFLLVQYQDVYRRNYCIDFFKILSVINISLFMLINSHGIVYAGLCHCHSSKCILLQFTCFNT